SFGAARVSEQSRTRADWLLLIGFCAFLFFFGLNYFGLIGADEPRYAQIAREMLVRHDWITPVLGGKPWLEKRVLYYWQAMLAYSICGVCDWAARIPSAVAATLLVIAVSFSLPRPLGNTGLRGAPSGFPALFSSAWLLCLGTLLSNYAIPNSSAYLSCSTISRGLVPMSSITNSHSGISWS